MSFENIQRSILPAKSNPLAPRNGIAFDGTSGARVSSNITGQNIGTDSFSVNILLEVPTVNPSVSRGIWYLASSNTTNNVANSSFAEIKTAGELVIYITGSASSDVRTITFSNFRAIYSGKRVLLSFVRDSSASTMTVYANGTELSGTAGSVGTPPAWSGSVTSTYFVIGNNANSIEAWANAIYSASFYNLALSASDIIEINELGGAVPFRYQFGSQVSAYSSSGTAAAGTVALNFAFNSTPSRVYRVRMVISGGSVDASNLKRVFFYNPNQNTPVSNVADPGFTGDGTKDVLLIPTTSGIGLAYNVYHPSVSWSGNYAVTIFQVGAVVHFPFDEGSGTTAYDQSSNALNATLTSTSWAQPSRALITGGNLVVSGGTITGGTSGLSLNAGGTNQNITLTPSGTGAVSIVKSETNTNAITTALNYLKIQNSNSGGTYIGALEFYTWDNRRAVGIFAERNNVDGTSGTLSFAYSTSGNSFTEGFRLSSSGNVGIGVTAPSSKLDIGYQGSFNTTTPGKAKYGLHFSGQTTADYATGITFNGGTASVSDAQAGIYVQGSGSYGSRMFFATTDSYATGAITRMAIDSAGNIGIGITSPATKLDIRAANTNGATTTLRIGTQTHGGSGDSFANMEFYWGDPDSPHVSSKIYAINTGNVGPGGGGAADIRIATAVDYNSPTLVDRLIVKNDGNVIIGDTVPAGRLYVKAATTNDVALTIKAAADNPTADIIQIFRSGGSIIGKFAAAADAGYFRVGYAGLANNVAWVDISGYSNTSIVALNRGSTGSDTGIKYLTNGATKWSIGEWSTRATNNLNIINADLNGTPLMTFQDGTGRVGINNTSPTEALEIGTNSAGNNVKINSTLGSELVPALTAGNWTGTNWSATGTTITHTTGTTGSISPTSALSISAGKVYKVVMTLSTGGGAYHNFSLGGKNYTIASTTSAQTWYVYTTSTANFTISNLSNGDSTTTITAISIKEVLATTGTLSVEGPVTFNSTLGINNLGIGTTSSWTINAPLEVIDYGGNAIRVTRQGAATQYLAIHTGNGGQFTIAAIANGNDKPFVISTDAVNQGIQIHTGSSRRMEVLGSGKIVTSPSAYSLASWTTTGSLFEFGSATVTNSSTAASTTAASAVFYSFAAPTLAATNASVTTTAAATVYIAGDVAAGTNQTITNSYGLWNVGKTRLDGNVGIGVAPSYKLDVAGAGGGNIGVRLTPDNGKVRFYGYDILGYNTQNIWMISNDPTNKFTLGTSWDWDSSCDLIYTPGTYGAVAGSLLIGQTSKNSATFTHGYTALYTNGAEKLRLTRYGTLLVGDNIEINGSWYNNGIGIFGKNGTDKMIIGYLASSTNGALIGAHNSALNAWAVTNINGSQLVFRIQEAEKMRIDAAGNVGIGNSSPGSLLDVTGAKNTSPIYITQTTPASANAFGDYVGLDFRMYNEIYPSPQFTGNPAARISAYLEAGSNIFGLDFWTRSGSTTFSKAMRITGGGNVGIGTPSPGYKLEVNGSFAATTKSFVIKHPTKEGKKLRYGSLEGPENGVYVRGKTTSKVIELPDYWTKLIDPESITVQLTPIGSHQKLYVEKIENNKVYIANENLLAKNINCFFYILAERADVEKLQVEIDA